MILSASLLYELLYW